MNTSYLQKAWRHYLKLYAKGDKHIAEGRARVRLGKKYGFVDKSGKETWDKKGEL
mgnify:CR=1 FL=1